MSDCIGYHFERVLDGDGEHRGSIVGGVSIHLYIHQKGNLNPENRATDNRAQRTPTPRDNMKVFGEVSFSHAITGPTNGKSAGSDG